MTCKHVNPGHCILKHPTCQGCWHPIEIKVHRRSKRRVFPWQQFHNKVWRSQSLPAQCWAFPLPCTKHCRGCSAGTLATRNWWESVIRVIGLIRFCMYKHDTWWDWKMHAQILSRASQKAWLPVLLADSASGWPSRVPSLLILVHRLPQFHPADHLAKQHYLLASRNDTLNRSKWLFKNDHVP